MNLSKGKKVTWGDIERDFRLQGREEVLKLLDKVEAGEIREILKSQDKVDVDERSEVLEGIENLNREKEVKNENIEFIRRNRRK